MELKEFVSRTLIEIIDGVESARKAGKGAVIAPSKEMRSIARQGDVRVKDPVLLIDFVHFEVILTDNNVSSSGGGIGVSFGSFGAGFKSKRKAENTSCTRVEFTIPLVFPEE